MNILGISFGYHDAAAALIMDDQIVAASQEERFSRKKNDPTYPKQAIEFCLDHGGLSPSDLSHVAYYELPIRKFDRIFKYCSAEPDGQADLNDTFDQWIVGRKFDVREQICEHLEIAQNLVHYGDHHRSHAASAFFTSPFDEAAIVTIDGVGEHETATLSTGRGNEIDRFASVAFPSSLGLFYSALTSYLGFEIGEGEYKVMGLASFGRPVLAKEILSLFELHDDGTFETKQHLFDIRPSALRPFNDQLIQWLGTPRLADSIMEVISEDGSQSLDQDALRFADIAASVQYCAEQVVLHVVECAMKRTGMQNVCLAGGVALNSVINGRIQRELGADLFVQSAAGDAGGALGAALALRHCEHNKPRPAPISFSPTLGQSFEDAEVTQVLRSKKNIKWQKCTDERELIDETAEALFEQKAVGWFQGRSEWGPRALGNRSILADPSDPRMKFLINDRVKFREQFRPFAPSVLAEFAEEYFELDGVPPPHGPEAYMLSVCRVRPDKISLLPAVTHVDGTARIHVVHRSINPLFYDLISKFQSLSGIPLLLNTSFNRRGEPIVNSPAEAVSTFQWSGLDQLSIGLHVVEKVDVLQAMAEESL